MRARGASPGLSPSGEGVNYRPLAAEEGGKERAVQIRGPVTESSFWATRGFGTECCRG